jgi:hypothetical protein
MTRALTQQARVRTNTTQGSVCNIQVEAVTFAKLWAAYPSGHPYVDPRTGKPPPGYDNQCAINISVAIHGVGVEMKSFKGAFVIVNGYRAASVASQLAAWLKLQPFCGLPPAPENVTGLDWQHKIRGRTGIVYFEDYWARNEKEKSTHKPTGDHVDLWNGSRMTAAGAHFFSAWGRRLGFPAIGAGTDWGYSDVGQSKLILFWEVK